MHKRESVRYNETLKIVCDTEMPTDNSNPVCYVPLKEKKNLSSRGWFQFSKS